MSREIKTIHANSRATYGSLRVHACLLEQGEMVSRFRVARIMPQHGIRGKTRGKFRVTTNSDHPHPVAENRLEPDFKAEKPDQKWAADITYLPTLEGWLYLAVVREQPVRCCLVSKKREQPVRCCLVSKKREQPVRCASVSKKIDLFSRKVVGWSMGESLGSKLVLDALLMARDRRKPESGLLHHSDRGVQYAARDFQRALARLEAIPSMSRKGDCWDNAVVESFFSTLKLELDLDGAVGSRVETRAVVFEWIEVWYNRQRRHSSLGYRSPAVFERSWAKTNRVSTKP